MAATNQFGRDVTITINAVVIATAKTKSFSIDNTVGDVTSDGDGGLQELLDKPGKKSVVVNVEGMAWQPELMDIALSTTDITVEVIFTASDFTLTGTMAMTNFTQNLEDENPAAFTASLSSSGAFVKAAVP